MSDELHPVWAATSKLTAVTAARYAASTVLP